MSEETTPITSPDKKSSPKKKKNWKTIITIIFLALPGFWPIGLILTWVLAPWRRKIKLIITVIIAVLFIIYIVVLILFWEPLSGRLIDFADQFTGFADRPLIFNMDQIQNKAEMIYSDEENYEGVSCMHPEISVFCSELTATIKEKPTIHASGDTYCAYTKLFSEKYFCIDSRQVAHETTIYPGETGYCDGTTFICP